jgi:N-acetylmuramoyl-L-alanine amidase
VHTRTYQRIWQYFKQHRVASIVAGHVSVVAVLVLLLLGNTLGSQILGAFAQAPCSSSDRTYIVHGGDTLSGIASRYNTSWPRLAAFNRIAHPSLIYVNQTVCIPGGGSPSPGRPGPGPVMGRGNFFSYAQCTWWANQRYHQLHGIYVPWTINSNAWAWANRARDFHWVVSSYPTVGDIVDLQPWVQGAYGLGHVAVVERVLGNGHVIASTMNWGVHPGWVTYVEYAPGPGVSFIHF